MSELSAQPFTANLFLMAPASSISGQMLYQSFQSHIFNLKVKRFDFTLRVNCAHHFYPSILTIQLWESENGSNFKANFLEVYFSWLGSVKKTLLSYLNQISEDFMDSFTL